MSAQTPSPPSLSCRRVIRQARSVSAKGGIALWSEVRSRPSHAAAIPRYSIIGTTSTRKVGLAESAPKIVQEGYNYISSATPWHLDLRAGRQRSKPGGAVGKKVPVDGFVRTTAFSGCTARAPSECVAPDTVAQARLPRLPPMTVLDSRNSLRVSETVSVRYLVRNERHIRILPLDVRAAVHQSSRQTGAVTLCAGTLNTRRRRLRSLFARRGRSRGVRRRCRRRGRPRENRPSRPRAPLRAGQKCGAAATRRNRDSGK